MLFAVKDFKNVSVSLSSQTWFKKLLDPIFGHPEIKPYLSKIKLAIKNPDFVYQSQRDSRSKLFYKAKIGKGKFLDCYLVVVIKYVKEPSGLTGYVSTVMFNRLLPKKDQLIWQKKASF